MNKLLNLYASCIKQANQAFIKNLVIIPGMIISYVALLWLNMAVAPLGMAGGFILGMAAIALLALYYNWINRTIDREKLKFSQLIEFDVPLFFQLISVAFIFWIALDLLLGSVSAGTGDNTIKLCAQLAAFILFNSIPEVIYRHNLEGVHALSNSFEFTKENYIEWYLPVLVLLLWPLLVATEGAIIQILAQSQPLLPFKLIFDSWPRLNIPIPLVGSIIGILIPLLVAHWFMLFRGYLFIKLSSGYRR